MTKENYIIFDLEDIQNIKFECKARKSGLSVHLSSWEKSTLVCGNCRDTFLKDGSVEQDAIENLKKAVKSLILTKKARNFKARFELPTHQSDEISNRPTTQFMQSLTDGFAP
jgi:hypothetical protein